MGGWYIRYGRTFLKNNELLVRQIGTKGLIITIENGRLIMVSLDHIDSLDYEHFIEYKFDDMTADILLRNLCMGNSIQTGLKIEKRYHNSSSGYVPESSCFIATAVYRNKYAPEVILLRHFRDSKLFKSQLGRMFNHFYYATSPFIARRLIRHDKLRLITKKILVEPILWIILKIFYKEEN